MPVISSGYITGNYTDKTADKNTWFSGAKFVSGASLTIKNGGHVDDTTFSQGATVTVNSNDYGMHGGSIGDGGVGYIANNGFATNVDVYGNGNIYVQSGGVYNYNTTHANGTVTVQSGGLAYTNFVDGTNGGNAQFYVQAGGTARDVRVNNNGTATISGAGASLSGGYAGNAGTVIVTNGASVSVDNDKGAFSVNSGGTLNIQNNGSGTGVVFNNGGTGNISSGGYGLHDSYINGGVVNFYNGSFGTTNHVSGGTVNVKAGAVYNYNYTDAGGSVVVENNGTAYTNFVSGKNAKVTIQGGGHGFDAQVGSGGTYLISGIPASGNNSGSIAYLSGGNVTNGGVVSAVNNGSIAGFSDKYFNVQSGGVVSIGSNGSAGHINVDQGGFANVSGASNYGLHDSVINSGGNLTLSAGGFATNVSANGGTVTVGSGGIYNYNYTNANGSVIVQNGGLAWTNFVSGRGAKVTIESGGLGSDARVGSAGKYIVNGGKLNQADVSSGGIISVSSGMAGNVTVEGGGEVDVSSGATISGATVSSGGTLYVSGGVLSGNVNVMPGATMRVDSITGGGTITLSGDGSQLIIDGTTMPSNTISGWTHNDKIDLTGIPSSSLKNYAVTDDGVTFYTTKGNFSLNIPGAKAAGYRLDSDSAGNIVYTTCFASGTHIATPDGEKLVESLVPGTLVMTPKGAMPVKWLGHRFITVSKQSVPEENWLVRICKDAFADGIPARDLLVTQEHCMVFDGKLIPARMLVNGRSILIDRSIGSYTYYHVELASHEAIWAEDALTESYLDTGNRSQFDNHTVTTLFGGARSGGSEILPLDTSRAFVEPIYENILARAGKGRVLTELTHDPDLHLITEQGVTLKPVRQSGRNVIFIIPAHSGGSVRLVSRAGRPSDTIGPFVDDRRTLGILVGKILFFETHQTTSLRSHLDDARLPGWHGIENAPCRWTNGDAILPIPYNNKNYSCNEPKIVSIEVVTSGPYIMVNDSCNINYSLAG